MQKINQVLSELDALFAKGDTGEIQIFLEKQIAVFKENKETDNLITMLNEMIGFCRDTTQKEKALKYCNELFALLEEMNLHGSVEYATALLNIANAYRAFL